MEKTIIRLEKKEDYRVTENLIRESFWNVYRPGCSEHYVMHVLRDDPAFIPELDFVMEQDGKLIGQNMFMKTVINADDGRNIPVLTMGPIGITPELKRKGYGKRLLDFCLEKAEKQKEREKKRKAEQENVMLVYDQSIAEEYRREQEAKQAEEKLPGQIEMELDPEEEIIDQKPEMTDRVKMMRFQAAQVDKIIMRLNQLNDTMSMILRAVRKE